MAISETEHHHAAPRRTPATRFIGRERELADIRRLLDERRLVTLTGVGGSGKTRLALEIARERDGAVVVELAPVNDPAWLYHMIASGLGASGPGPGGSARDVVHRALSEGSRFVVLDNCEHLVDACAELVVEIVERCPEVTLLATSREALDVDGEQLFPVGSLDLETDSVRLFVDRASAVRPTFTLDDEAAPVVREICRRLDGIPLAIELAAARVSHLSLAQIAGRLDDRFDLLTGGRQRLERHRTLEATMDWSYELLDDAERAMLRRASVFAGGFTLEAAEEACASDDAERARTVDVLGSLVAKSLIEADETDGAVRLNVLETVRLYARDKLEAADEVEVTRARHRDHFLAWAEALLAAEGAITSDRMIAMVEAELPNLRAAMAWSFQQGRPSLAVRILSLTPSFFWVPRSPDGETWDAVGERASDDLDAATIVRFYVTAAEVSFMDQDHALIDERAQRAIEAAGARPIEVLSLAYMSRHSAALQRGDLEAALGFLDQAEATAGGVQPYTAQIGYQRAMVAFFAGEYAHARRVLETTSHDLDPARFSWILAACRAAASISAFLDGDAEAASTAAAEAMAAAERASTEVMSVGVAAAVTAADDDHERVFDALVRTLEFGRRRGVSHMITPDCLVGFGVLAARSGDNERAATLLAAAGFPMGPTGPVAREWATRVRERLDADTWQRAHDAGFAMGPDNAVSLAVSHRTRDDADATLTLRELEVARLVAEGSTNREIAERLVVSVRTVDAHLEHIRTKLGMRSRAQIAAWLVESDAKT